MLNFKIFVIALCAIFSVTEAFRFISASDTLLNLLGLAMLIATPFVSFKLIGYVVGESNESK